MDQRALTVVVVGSGDYDALILAAIGLKRLGLENRISQVRHRQSYSDGCFTARLPFSSDPRQVDCIITVSNGLINLMQVFDSSIFGYAVGQGALAVVCRTG